MADSGEGGKDPARLPPPPLSFVDQIDQIEAALFPPPQPHLSQGRDERDHPAHPLSEGPDPPLLSFVSGSKFLRGQIAKLHQLNQHIPCISHFSSARIHHTAPVIVHVFFYQYKKHCELIVQEYKPYTSM